MQIKSDWNFHRFFTLEGEHLWQKLWFIYRFTNEHKHKRDEIIFATFLINDAGKSFAAA